jgi:tubulin alpha
MANETENTEREVLHLQIGSAGIDIGNHCWELYCLEHNLDVDGCLQSESNSGIPPRCFFSERKNDNGRNYCPHTFFIDHDSTEIDKIKTSKMKNLYNENQFFVPTNSSDSIMDKIRHQIEIYDNFQGFIFSHSTFGKSSNLSSELLINLKSEYSNKIILTNSIFGSSIDICSMSNLLNYADVIIPMENKAIHNLCQQRLEIETPTYFNLNRLIAMCWSNITCSMRFDGCFLSNLNEFQTTLIPTPSFKLISSYLSPLIPYSHSQNTDFKSPSVYDMCIPSLIQPNNCCISQTSSSKMLMALALLFRGENLIPKEIGQKLICDMKKWIRFPDSCPTGFRCGMNYHRPYVFNNQSEIALTDKQVLMLTNEMTTAKYLCEIVLNQNVETSKDNEEKIEALQQLKTNYELIEKEILHDYELD